MKSIILISLFISLNTLAGEGGSGGGPRMDRLIIQNIDTIRTNKNEFIKPDSFILDNIPSVDISEIYLKNGNVLSKQDSISQFLEFTTNSILK